MKKNPIHTIISKDELYKLYVIQNKSSNEIGEAYGYTHSTVNKLLTKYNIPKKKTLKQMVTKDELFKYYIIENLTQEELAKKLNCGLTSVENLIKEYGIVKKRDYKKIIPKNVLIDLYHNEDKSMNQIAREFGTVHGTIRRLLKEYGIAKKKTSYEMIDKNLLYNLYIEEEKSSYEIADIYDLSPSQITRMLREYGIETRRTNDFVDLGIEFELIVKEMFLSLEKKYEYQYEGIEGIVPDFYDKEADIIIDAKLSSDNLYDAKFKKYTEKCSKVIVVYLLGNRISRTENIEWVNINEYFPELKLRGFFDLIKKVEDLKNTVKGMREG